MARLHIKVLILISKLPSQAVRFSKTLRKTKEITVSVIGTIKAIRAGSHENLNYLERKALHEEVFKHDLEVISSMAERTERIFAYTEFTRLRDLFKIHDDHKIYFLGKGFAHLGFLVWSILSESKRIQIGKLTGLKTIPVTPLSFIAVSTLSYSTFAFLEAFTYHKRMKTVMEFLKYGTGVVYIGSLYAVNALTHPIEKIVFKKPIEISCWDDPEMASFLLSVGIKLTALRYSLRKSIDSIEPIDATVINAKDQIKTSDPLTFIKKPSINFELIKKPKYNWEVKLESDENNPQFKELNKLGFSRKISNKILEILFDGTLDIF